MITLRWAPLENADIASYKIYRAMIGVKSSFEEPFGLSGDDLQLKVNNDNVQTIVFNDDLNVVLNINANLVGGTAYEATDTDHIIIRSNVRTSPGFLVIVGGSAASKIGLPLATFSEASSMVHIGTIPFGETEFIDPDGVLEDYYAISTIDSGGNESNLSNPRQAINFTGPICVVEGCITDLQGKRVCDVKVLARIVTPPESVQDHSFITKKEISTLTGEDGRFSLPILQKASVIFEIDDTRISDPICIPERPYVFFDELPIDYNYKLKDYN
jgi:hypothetical protein